jgi:hypothetical protein
VLPYHHRHESWTIAGPLVLVVSVLAVIVVVAG